MKKLYEITWDWDECDRDTLNTLPTYKYYDLDEYVWGEGGVLDNLTNYYGCLAISLEEVFDEELIAQLPDLSIES